MSKVVFGASLSDKLCEELGIDPIELVEASINDLSIRRFRLMTYWDQCEPKAGEYDFSKAENLVKQIERAGGQVSLCLGLRQPRWPECHPPKWAQELSKTERDEALMKFIEATIIALRGNQSVVEYQLENEALNRGIGLCDDYDRSRLKRKYQLVKQLDSSRPIVMSTSNSWGLPILGPIPDVVGFSMYRHQWKPDGLSTWHLPSWVVGLRKRIIERLLRRKVFCHELQAEPWGPKATQELSDEQQLELMNPDSIKEAIDYARAAKMEMIDLWGLEWWYWRKVKRDDPSVWEAVKSLLTQ